MDLVWPNSTYSTDTVTQHIYFDLNDGVTRMEFLRFAHEMPRLLLVSFKIDLLLQDLRGIENKDFPEHSKESF